MKRISLISLILLIAFSTMILHRDILSIAETLLLNKEIGTYEAKNGGMAIFENVALKLNKPISDVIAEARTQNETTVIIPAKAMIMSLNKSTNEQIPLIYIIINFIFALCLIIFSIWIYVLFFVIFTSFWKSNVFEEKNIKRFRKTGIFFITIALLNTTLRIFDIIEANRLIDLEFMTYSYSDCIDWDSLTTGLIILLFNEILKFSLNIKTEQDLTI